MRLELLCRKNLRHREGHIPSINVPVHVGGVTVHPGDLIHGDRNGVTTIPFAVASEVPQACAELAEAEAVVMSYLMAGKVTMKGFAEARGECKRRIDELARRLKGKG